MDDGGHPCAAAVAKGSDFHHSSLGFLTTHPRDVFDLESDRNDVESIIIGSAILVHLQFSII